MNVKSKLLDIFCYWGGQKDNPWYPTIYRHNLTTGWSIEIRCGYMTVFISSALERKYENRSQNNEST
tara:strand:+ start:390 stop:590 length:201 start_codon:yes stop_codon:yes gene_type:complete